MAEKSTLKIQCRSAEGLFGLYSNALNKSLHLLLLELFLGRTKL